MSIDRLPNTKLKLCEGRGGVAGISKTIFIFVSIEFHDESNT
jgi:hypothetical protein